MFGESIRATRELALINFQNWQRTYGMAQVALTKRYSGSALGVTWAVLRPAIYITAYWFAVSIGLRGSASSAVGAPYILWLIPGNLAWFFMSECLREAGDSIRRNSQFVTKMSYPVATLPVSEVLSHFLVHLVMICLNIILLLVSGYGLTFTAFQLPYYMLCGLVLSLVVSTLFSAVIAISADIGHLIKSGLQLLFWVTPVLWSATKIGLPFRYIILANPLAYVIQGYRDSLVLHNWVTSSLPYTAYFWGLMAVLTLLSSFVFTRLAPEFADVL
ncbi:MAG: ABC transporter permease [Propionicimonas sp.]|uniref:ABC transporter permease n=1 Tax=Propionicimonas sp. TaxID=1955623 RepID=UPI003D11FE4B